MIGAHLKAGDVVIVTIPQENRDGGYAPCPDGTKGTIIGFPEASHGRIRNYGLKPGIYANRAWSNLLLEDGNFHCISSFFIELSDPILLAVRRTELQQRYRETDGADEKEYLRDLPETPFWEGDYVLIRDRSLAEIMGQAAPSVDRFQVVGISYLSLDETTLVGTPYPAYEVSEAIGAGWHTSAAAADMTLAERGPVWKHFHGEPIEFKDLREEADFFARLGHVDDVRNPTTGDFAWNKDQALEAIRNGVAHSIVMSPGCSGAGPTIIMHRYRDQALGQRIAKATLQGFAVG